MLCLMAAFLVTHVKAAFGTNLTNNDKRGYASRYGSNAE